MLERDGAPVIGPDRDMFRAGLLDGALRADSRHAWQSIADAAELRRDNHEAIDACEQQAAKAKQPVRCTIRVRYRQP